MDTYKEIDVAGLKISAITKQEFLAQIADRVSRKVKTFVVTPYSEFLYAALRDLQVRNLLNSADFAIADGVGILWADLYMSLPLTVPGFYSKILQAWWQVVWTGASILLHPKSIYKNIPEKIVGADVIWDLAEIAAANNFKVYLLGSKGDIAKRVGEALMQKYPNLQIVGTSNKFHDDPTILDDLNAAQPDMIFVTFNRLTQEKWIADNLEKTSASFAIGLGGTFDYITGEKTPPPKFVRKVGLEWFYRLITQPTKFMRIYEGFAGMIISLVRTKVYGSMPYRDTGTTVVINKDKKVLICLQAKEVTRKFHPTKVNYDYWQFPQGGIQEGEDVVSGAIRELYEETGIKSVEVIGEANYKRTYHWNNALRPFLTSHYKRCGVILHTVFVKFTGDESEIKLDQKELINYQWVSISDVNNVIAEERREHASIVLAELEKLQL